MRLRSLLTLALLPWLAGPIALIGAERPAFAQADTYKQHMENGVKLYQDKNYAAAIEEFRAAYAAKPKASPLQNIALCYKAQFDYPKAIGSLETALSKHADTMDASDKKAAEDAIVEMKKLLGFVTVKVTPPEATVLVDGQPTNVDASKRPIPLSPGPHKIGAKAEGYALAEEPINVTSGERDKVVTLRLVPDQGYVSIDATDPRGQIVIDQKVMGMSSWAGLVPPGTHIVQIARPGLAVYSVQIIVTAGQAQTIKPGYGGMPVGGNVTQLPTYTESPPKKIEPPAPQRKGPFALATASFLIPTTHPPIFQSPETNSGGSGGIRVGYRLSTPVAFDLQFGYLSAFTPKSSNKSIGYHFGAWRLGADLRLMTSGKVVRFVGSMGGGLTVDKVRFDSGTCGLGADADCSGFNASGPDAFVTGEAGIEIEISHVLLGAALQADYQSAGSLNYGTGSFSLYEGSGIPWVGGGVRIGYSLW